MESGTGAARSSISMDAGQATPLKEETPGEGKKYVGQKLSLDFKDADIKNVFRLLAEVSGLNIVVTNDVNRRVTLRLVEVPWDQAMDLSSTPMVWARSKSVMWCASRRPAH